MRHEQVFPYLFLKVLQVAKSLPDNVLQLAAAVEQAVAPEAIEQ